MDIVFLISHLPDPRYKKRFVLLQNQYDIAVIYWNKRKDDMVFSDISIEKHEISIRANQTSPLKRIPQWLKYGKKAIDILSELKPRCIYVGNFDMLYIAEQYQKAKDPQVRLIYEIADLHRYLVDDSGKIHRQLLKTTLIGIESKLLKKIDLLVLTSQKFYDVYYNRWVPEAKVIFLPNMPRQIDFERYHKVTHSSFTIGYVGTIRYKDQLKMLISAAKTAGVNVYFAGASSENDSEIEKLCEKNASFCTYRGAYNYSRDIVDIYEHCDAVYSVYDATLPNVRVALPNKLYEAILCELPLIVAKGTYLSELVEKMGIGISVSHDDKKELKDALLKLKNDKDYYNELCNNCKINRKLSDADKYNEIFIDSIQKLMK